MTSTAPSSLCATVPAEAVVLGSVLAFPESPMGKYTRLVMDHAPESFADGRVGQAARAFVDMVKSGKEPQMVSNLIICCAEKFPIGAVVIREAVSPAVAEMEAEPVWKDYQTRQSRSILDDALAALEIHAESTETIVQHAVEALGEVHRVEDGTAELLSKRQFNPDIVPPPIRPIYTLGGSVVSTPGNLTTITAAIKAGKTAVIGAMMAAPMAGDNPGDMLGFSSSNPNGFALLHFDSEQSPDDHWHVVNRALKRSGLTKPPSWFYSYCLTGLGYRRGWECFTAAVRDAGDRHGGIISLLIDGAADLVKDVNDPGESNAFVAELHDLAIKRDCPILSVIHFNPGGEKTRGHLGSQLERKSETNLRLDKVDGVTEIWSDKQRRAPIPKGTGPCFAWSDEVGMHVSVETRCAVAVQEKTEELSMLADDLFSDRPSMHYTDLVSAIGTKLKLKGRTPERRAAAMAKLGVIKKSVAGLWVKAT